MTDDVRGRGADQHIDEQISREDNLYEAPPSREVAGFVDRFAKDFANAYQRQIDQRRNRENDQSA